MVFTYTPFFICQIGFVTVTSLVKKYLLTIAGQTYFQELYPTAIAPTWLKYKLEKEYTGETPHE